VDTMTENLVSLLDNKEFAKTLGTAGKNNMKSNYTLERHIQSLQNTLENAIQHV
jgi:hypothetical protein